MHLTPDPSPQGEGGEGEVKPALVRGVSLFGVERSGAIETADFSQTAGLARFLLWSGVFFRRSNCRNERTECSKVE